MGGALASGSEGIRIGIDLGGTKIEGIALARDGAVLERRRIPTPSADYVSTLAAVVGLVHELERRVGSRGSVGVGTPGSLSPATGLVKNANSTCLIGHRLDRDLEAALGRPVRVANDANCFVLSEAVDGAAAGAAVVFGVILGTGVGGGIALDRRPLTGLNAIAGEWGHNPLPWPRDDERPGPRCYCGRAGCLEAFLSGPALAGDHQARSGDELSPPEIARRAEVGEPEAVASLERYADRLARGLASVINVLDPEVIVLGGGLSAIGAWYEEVPRVWGRYVFSDQVATRLTPPHHGAASGVRGAAWLWP